MDPTFELVIVRPQLRAKPAGLFFRRQRLKLDPRQKNIRTKEWRDGRILETDRKTKEWKNFVSVLSVFLAGLVFRKQLKGHIYSSIDPA